MPPESAGMLSRTEKQERLRAILLEKIGRTRTAPASFAQERLWFLDRLRPGNASYNVPEAQRLSGPLDPRALERALAEVVRRHEALRTTFAEADGVPVQVIAPFEGFTLAVEDLAGLDAQAREAEVARRVTDDAVRPFDLAAGPLLRARLLRLGDQEHVLLLCMHHIVSDGWSMGVLFHELSVLYAAFAAGEEPRLAPPPIQYADHAARQRERLAGDAVDRELAYWKARLAGAPTLLELPTDRPRPAVQTLEGAHVSAELSPVLLRRLQALARGEEATLYMVLLAAFQLLLSRYAGSDDVVVGSPVAGRRGSDEEALIGFFVNTLALRTDLSGDLTFRQLLRRVREVTLDAYEHQEVPFERVVEELHPERSLSYAPVFQAMFTLHDGRGPRGGLSALRMERVASEHGTTKFDLTLGMGVEDGFRAALEYSTDLFHASTAQRMLGHLERVLEQVAADPDTRLSALELADEAERRRVVVEWNRTEAAYPAEGIAALFAEQAARTPNAVAVVCEDASLTYAELDERANRLARFLGKRGVVAESRVGICQERGVEMVVSLLAILKAGGAYVPLDPAYPAERLALMLADSAVQVLLTQESLRNRLPAAEGVAVVSIDAEREEIAAERAEPVDGGAGPRALAYVIYTSGSTGTPKGVAVEQRSVVRLVRGANYVDLGPGEAVLQAAPVSFDASTLELWGPLLNGGRVVIVPGSNPSLEELGGTLTRHGVTTLWLTAGLFQVMVQERLDDLRGVRQLLAGGDVLPVEQVRRVRERFPELRLINGYGPTENTTFTCCHTVDGGWSGGPVPIGTPISNTRVYVLDAAMRPVPIGVPGELYAGGDGVARGYLNRPALTAERFVPDPFSFGARLYRTGDRVRWTEGSAEVRECVSAEVEDGVRDTHALTHSRTHALHYLGRLDEQAKIRGFRIEPGEVETALRRHAQVDDCTVVVREDEPGEKRLVAYVVGDADADALRAHLRGRLPEYMVPAAFVSLDALPLTPNGKVDRRALPAPDFSAEDLFVAPRTPVEEVLAGIWAEVLRLERVGVHESFFALGGHSLFATRVVSRIRAVLGVELPLRALFEGPTVAELARAVEELRRAELPQLPPVVPVDRTRPLPLSFAQERLWFLDRLEPGSPLYNVPAALRLSGELHAAALERALGEIVRRHEALRTTFAEADGAPVQVVAPFAGFELQTEDLSALDGDERTAAMRQRVAEESARPFELAAGPLFRALLLRLADDEHVLLLNLHHVVADGWSLGVLFRELSALYLAFRDGGEPPLDELPVQYADYAVWQREQLRGQALDRQLAYWKARLAGAPALLQLPTDRPRPAAQTYRGAHVPVEIPAALLERLDRLQRGEGATLYMALLAAFAVLLSRYGGGEDVVVGSPIAGRTRAEAEELIGFFANTLVLRTDLSGDPAFREVLRRVRETTLGAYDHQDVPFEQLVAELQPERSLSHAPLFQVMLSLQTGDFAEAELAGVRTAGVAAGGQTTKYDLVLTLAPDGDGLRGAITYGTELFERATVERMAAHLVRVLDQVATDPDLRLSRLSLADAAERRRVLEDLNRADTIQVAHPPVHQRFAEQAARTPDAVAATCGAESLTYRALDERSNRLARHLAGLGVRTDARVGICLERGLQQVVAVLAILKAGGAYVPLDPGAPAERLELMLADSGAAVLVTQERLRAALPARPGIPVVRVDADADAIAAESPEPLADAATADSLAYVIYTSGSTGTPKGVAVPHGALSNYLAWFDRTVLGDEGFALPVVSRLSFDAHVRQLYPPLLRGEAAWILPEETATDPAALLAELSARGGRVSFGGVPTIWSAMVDLVQAGKAPRPENVVAVLAGGDTLPAELAERTFALFPDVALWNHYGPTEATVNISAARVRPGEPIGIGRPVSNARVYLLDAHGEPVPAGIPGELHVGGAGVARGYLGRPALTAERFIPDPFSTAPGARMYRTGDRVRWTERSAEVREGVSAGVEEGARTDSRTDALTHSRTTALEYLGRLDGQVKVRGFRIEPGEIEAVLRRQPGVRQCAVVAREDLPGDRRLVAYVAGDADTDALRAALRKSLPEYMVPGDFVALDALPLTPGGKVDRRALPAPAYDAEEGFVAPRTPAEEVLAGIWADVLGVEQVGSNDNFFQLGGHSLLATVMIGLVREALAVELPLRALFEGPTVAHLAARVEALRRAGLPPLPPVVPVERTGPPPLSFAQERLWFLDRLQPGSSSYNVATVLRLEGALEPRTLERVLGEIVRRHQALRTVFREVNGVPVQVVAPFGGFALHLEDLSDLDDAQREARARRRASEEAKRPFDLAEGPLFRARLLRLGAEDHVLVLCMHHIVTDWWSTGILLRELSALYAAYRDGRPSPLPEPAVQYADYAVWQREQMRAEVLDRQLGWWKERLAGAPALLELPTDRPRPAVQSYRGAVEPVELPAALRERLRALGQREGATLYMVLLAAWQVLLAKYSGSDDIVVGSPIAGRTRRETEGLIGFFVNTLALRTDLSGDPGFRQVLRRVREVTLGAYDHQEVPFEKLVAEMQPERSLSHSPLFQVMFSWGNAQGVEGAGAPGLRMRLAGAEKDAASFDLTLGLADDLHGFLEYSTDLFERDTIRRMRGHLERLLQQAVDNPDRPIGALSLLDEGERRQVVEEWNRTEAMVPAGACIHHLFQAQVERTPDAPALVFEEDSLTYAELNAHANGLARRLSRLGVGPEVRVGLCLERSVEMVVSILAVLKAGGAYVPLDPGYPAERLAWMLADSAVPVLLTQERLRSVLPAGTTAHVVAVDAPSDAVAGEGAEDFDGGATPANLAYVIYTSGSTGRPKGVMNAHGGVVNRLCWMQAEHGLGADDVVLQKTPFSFDVSVWEFFWPLMTGATLVVARPDGHRDPAYLREVIESRGVTTLHFVPSMLQPFVEDAEAGRCASLKRVMCSGEALPSALVERFHARFSSTVNLYNLYGPTEAAVDVSHWACERRSPVASVPIGRPVWNTRLYVLDAALRPIPVGLPGELYIGGVQVARGYLNRPDLTAERFVADPFSSGAGARLYRTGDRARWRADGALEYLGRLDHQVKIRGLRIEPGEVEAALRRHPAVADCAVVVREDAPGDPRLVAYVVAGADAEALRARLGTSLPDYMVPAALVAMDALPVTPNGKLDRGALPAPEYAAVEAYTAPRTPTEERLAAIWAEVLRRERVGVNDSFFVLGGHSLLATRAVSRVREAFGVELPLRAVFETPTVAGVALRVEALMRSRVDDDALAEALAALNALSEDEVRRLLGGGGEMETTGHIKV
ncbi:MAG TPA: amino acid adenylation domain-containing protein [Longimicrobium sp.]